MLAYAKLVTASEATILSLFFVVAAIQWNDGHLSRVALSRVALAAVTAGLV
jgi:hypothetical protein